jgi:hypothetical protein
VAQAVCRLLFTAEAPFLSQVSSCEICDAQSGITASFSTSTSVLPRQYHSTDGKYSFFHVSPTPDNLNNCQRRLMKPLQLTTIVSHFYRCGRMAGYAVTMVIEPTGSDNRQLSDNIMNVTSGRCEIDLRMRAIRGEFVTGLLLRTNWDLLNEQ